MPHISTLVSVDTRNQYQRMKLHRVQRLLNAYGIEYDAHSGKDPLIKLLEAHSIDPLAPLPNGEENKWAQVVVADENGNQHIESYPEVEPHHTAGKEIDYSQVIDKVAEENAKNELEQENQALKDRLNDMEKKLDALMPKEDTGGYTTPEISLENMKMPQLKKLAKEKGLKALPTMKKVEIIKMIEDHG